MAQKNGMLAHHDEWQEGVRGAEVLEEVGLELRVVSDLGQVHLAVTQPGQPWTAQHRDRTALTTHGHSST